jgi:hypothetical protein
MVRRPAPLRARRVVTKRNRGWARREAASTRSALPAPTRRLRVTSSGSGSRGTTKEGVLAAIAPGLHERPQAVPHCIIGVGETLEELQTSSARESVHALLS